jgi:DNA-binding IclR family transcriptional regulator
MVPQVMSVLRLFGPDRREIGVIEAAELLGRPKSTVSRWLKAMEEERFLERDPDSSRYRLSLVLAALGELARNSTSLQRVARPVLEELAAASGETSNLVVLDGDAAVNVEVVQSPRPIQHLGVLGRRLPLHATAAGKVLLAWLPPDARRNLLARPLRPCTPRTVTDADRLERELERVREQGYATAWKELEEDLAAASAPVRDHRGRVVAAVTTSAPVSRVTTRSLARLALQVREAAGRVSTSMGFSGEEP